MMVEQILTSLRQRGVQLWLEDGRVRYKAAADVLTPEVLAELRQHKAQIVELLRRNESVAAPAPAPAILAQATKGPRPLSFSQERMWFLDRLDPNSPVYNIPLALRLTGSLNLPALQLSFTEIIRRHESLRTTFDTVDDSPVQTIKPPGPCGLPVIDLTGLAVEQREVEAMRLAEDDARQPFDLTRDCLLRAKLYRLETTEHVLVVNLHHIASDGWSLDVLFRELGALYKAFVAGRSSPLPELPIQYADFGIWQRDWLRGDVLKQQLDFWRQRLANAPVLLDLPIDRPRPPVQTQQGRTMVETYPLSLSNAVQDLSRREGVSPFMTLLAAFQTLLHRYSRQDDILVGAPMACRNQTEIEGLIGLFVNTVVMRGDLSGNPTFRALLGQAREATLGALSHQELPFEKLVEELQPERNLAHTPLFQVMFVANNNQAMLAQLAGLSVTPLHLSTHTSKFDLTLYWELTGQGLSIHLEYNTDLFEAATIRRMIGHYRTLLEQVVVNPEQRVDELPLLTTAEHEQLVQWNDTKVSYPTEVCLHQLFEAQVAKTPDAVAVVFEDQQLTYRELDSRANQLARHLQSLGVTTESFVGVCMERSVEMVVALYATLKAGAAYVPIDPTYPADRVAFMLGDSSPPVLLTQERLVVTLPAHQSRVVTVDREWPVIAKQSAGRPDTKVTADNLAYMIYTSGSTGKPKGAMNIHRAIVNRLLWMQDTYRLGADDRVIQKTPFSFDVSVWEFFWPLLTGARLIVARPEGHRDSAYLIELIKRQAITTLHFVPSMLAVFLTDKGVGACRSLRRVICSGEALGLELQETFFEKLPAIELHNLYGPTEAAVDVTAWACRPNSELRTVPIGRPIANIQMHILGAHLHPVPVGVAGELHIAGVGLGRGYHNRPELTAEKFIANPFQPGTRVYKTGDLARYLTDGNIEYLGRLDHQVKIRGFRIELGEIEVALGQHPAVREVVVMAREDVPGDKRLVAYLTLKTEPELPVSELRAFLKERLPDYMVPTAFVRLEAMPLSPNGKIDRKTLPAPEDSGIDAGTNFVAPREQLEKQLAELWEDVFQRNPIGVRDNFFDLGGHSLLAVRLFARVEKLTGKNLPLVTLFQAPTIEQLAGVLRAQGWEAPWSSLVPIKADGTRPPFYCVHGVGGNILEYLDLAKYVDDDQPFYGIQAVGLDGKRAWLHSIEEQAAHHVKEIRAFQPVGPYYLGGSSYGGLVAYEMAQQLHRDGETVALLALFDTSGPDYPEYLTATSQLRRRWNHFCFRVALHWGNFCASTGRQKLGYLREKTKRMISRVGWHARRNRYLFQKWVEELTLPRAIIQTRKVSREAASRYVLQPYPGPAVLFRATEQPRDIRPDRLLGWGPYILGGLEIYDTPGHHGAIVRDPRAQKLAEQLQDALRKTQTARTPAQAPRATTSSKT